MTLNERETAILAFERSWWKHQGGKDVAVLEQFGLSRARYEQLVGALLDRADALEYDPQLVLRLQRIRERRRAQRGA